MSLHKKITDAAEGSIHGSFIALIGAIMVFFFLKSTKKFQ